LPDFPREISGGPRGGLAVEGPASDVLDDLADDEAPICEDLFGSSELFGFWGCVIVEPMPGADVSDPVIADEAWRLAWESLGDGSVSTIVDDFAAIAAGPDAVWEAPSHP